MADVSQDRKEGNWRYKVTELTDQGEVVREEVFDALDNAEYWAQEVDETNKKYPEFAGFKTVIEEL